MSIEPLRVSRLSLATLAIAAVSACGGPNQNMAPRTPGTTTLTSGTTAASPMDTEPGSPPQSEGPASPPLPPDIPRSDALPIQSSPTTAPQPASPRSDAVDSAALDDAQIAAIFDAVDSSEIDVSRAALTRATSWRVKELAARTIKAFDRASSTLRAADVRDAITPQEGPMSEQLRRGGEQALLTLRAAAGSDADRTYVDEQIEQHRNVIDLIDRFAPQVRSVALRNHLTELRHREDGALNAAMTVKVFLGM